MSVEAVVIGGSAGSVTALAAILPELPATFPAVLVVVHVLPSAPSRLPAVFSHCAMRVTEAEPGLRVERGTIYFAPSDYHLLVERDRRCALSIEPPVHFSRPSIDVLFETAAIAYGPRLAGVLLTGASRDGADGLARIHAAGGLAIVQDPKTAEADVMPRAGIAALPTATVVPLPSIARRLLALEPAS